MDRTRVNKALTTEFCFSLTKAPRHGKRYRRKTVLVFLVALLFLGCRPPTLDQLNYTRTRPKKADLVGIWIPNKSSLEYMQKNGGYDPAIQPKFVLRDDETFELSNMPDWWDNGFGESNKGFQSYSGKWIINDFKEGFWKIELRPPSGTRVIDIIGQSPPYYLEFTIGDPDENNAMKFTKQ